MIKSKGSQVTQLLLPIETLELLQKLVKKTKQGDAQVITAALEAYTPPERPQMDAAEEARYQEKMSKGFMGKQTSDILTAFYDMNQRKAAYELEQQQEKSQ